MRGYGFAFLLTLYSAIQVVAQAVTTAPPHGPMFIRDSTAGVNHSLSHTTTTLSRALPTTTHSTGLFTNGPAEAAGSTTGASVRKRIPAGAIAGIIIGIVALLALVLSLFFYKRRKQHKRDLSARVELEPIGSPIADKYFAPDPFITDVQAIGLGYDASQLPTRRIEAKFINPDEPNHPVVPRILLTPDGEMTGRPVSLSTLGHVRGSIAQSPTHYYAETPSPVQPLPPLPSSPASSSDTLTEHSASSYVSPHEENARRLRDILSQLENHAVSVTPGSSTTVPMLQRHVEALQRENERQHARGEAPPPAYDTQNRL